MRVLRSWSIDGLDFVTDRETRNSSASKTSLRIQPPQQVPHIRHLPIPAPPGAHAPPVQRSRRGPQRHMTGCVDVLHYGHQMPCKPVGIGAAGLAEGLTAISGPPKGRGPLGIAVLAARSIQTRSTTAVRTRRSFTADAPMAATGNIRTPKHWFSPLNCFVASEGNLDQG